MKKFLICHRGALGDFILTWPALHCLRKIYPDYEFFGVGRSEYMRLAIALGFLDSYINMESSGMFDFFNGKTIPNKIGDPEGAVLWLSKGEEVVNLLKRYASLPVISIATFPAKQIHAAQHYCITVQSHFPITIPHDLSDCFPGVEGKGNYALIHPGSGSSTKNYKPGFYRRVADELRQTGYRKPGFIFGPVEQEKMAAEEFAGMRIERPDNVVELANLLAGASLYIGNDSGVSHLSGILGRHTISLYKTTDPKIWGTLGRKVVHISAVNEETALLKIRECFRINKLKINNT